MSIREQAKTIIHERLHTYNQTNLDPLIFHEFVDDITEGLDVALDRYVQQDFWVSGFRRKPLSNEEVDKLKLFMRRIASLGLNKSRNDAHDSSGKRSFLKRFAVTPHGGGLIEQQRGMSLPEHYFVGIGSIAPSQIQNRTSLMDTTCYDPRTQNVVCELPGEYTTIRFVNLFAEQPDSEYKVRLGSSTSLENVDIRLVRSNRSKDSTKLLISNSVTLLEVGIINLHRVSIEGDSGMFNIRVEGRSTDSHIGSVPSLHLDEETRLNGSANGPKKPGEQDHKLILFNSIEDESQDPILQIKGPHFDYAAFDFSSPFCGPGRPAQLILRQRLSTITNPQKDAPTFCR